MFFFSKKHFLVDLIDGLTDIHNHILPNIDDGSKDLDMTLKMVEGMKSCGFKNAIATPHTMEDYYGNDDIKITNHFLNTKQELEGTHARDFIVHAASEYMMDSSFESLLDQDKYLCIKDSYILTELSYFQPPQNLNDLVFKMCSMDLIPILAHPERYRYFGSSKMESLIERGFELQLNLLSLSDHYGKDAFAKAEKYLLQGYYSYIGTDAHKPEHLEKLKNIQIKSKWVPATKKLMENHQLIFNS
ncbi:capsular biosynthesis protein [Nonlabens sp. MIC269]|uniref:tyrosine-protein phosphatase n=1 Tax=Nonlabens sp. MIC269 TaxID=1476901 RepID=UPI000721A1A9|nr:CpsB/CapC family capsule biosynthesis tyrosine phosphatase [Nonlabens sp. MIC269]ALM20082.1 capsular biosynthesis protein [Nonlabens sp. MIC269]